MKEQIIKILKNQITLLGVFQTSEYEDQWINILAVMIEPIVATEVDRRIEERMPTEKEYIDKSISIDEYMKLNPKLDPHEQGDDE